MRGLIDEESDKSVVGAVTTSAPKCLGQVDSRIPEERLISVAQVSASVMGTERKMCPGGVLNIAKFRWLGEDGMFIVEDRCGGESVRFSITGQGRLDHFAVLEDD